MGKLAYLVSEYPKVSHSFIRREIQALERQGWEVLRLAMRGWNAQLADADDIAEIARTKFVLYDGALPLIAATFAMMILSPRRFAVALFLLLRMMRHSDRPNLVHLIYLTEACWIARWLTKRKLCHLHAHFGTNPAEVAMLVHELSGIPYSFTIHGPEEFDRARTTHLGEKVRRAAFVVAVSSFCRSQIFRTVEQCHWQKVKVVHCGVDRSFSHIAKVEPSFANRLVCVGRLCEQKGQLLLVAATAALVKEGWNFKLILVGDGEQRAELEQLIAKYNIGHLVSITGWMDAESVRREILAARALVLPSFAEGLPVVLMEAMSLGRPVLTTYVAGIPELVVNGETGWLFPAGSEEELLVAMRSCLQAPSEVLQRMGDSGRKRALERHDIDKEAAKLAALFTVSLNRQLGAE